MKLDIKNRIQNYMRVLKVAKKPSWNEFIESSKICLAGLIVVGLIGFIIYLLSIISPVG